MIVHLLVRGLICWVSKPSSIHDPKLISFRHAIAFIREYIGPDLGLTGDKLLHWAIAALTQPAALLRRPPKPRSNPRQLKPPSIRYRLRSPQAGAATIPFDPTLVSIQFSHLAA